MDRPIVHIIGAGPGDPALLTLRAADVLARADVVVYDHLLDERVLDHAGDAERIDVAELSGAEVRELLVRLAREGRRVARVKDGDPFVFSSGVDEALALAEAGVPFEIVPGVTAGVAAPAFAGIPLMRHGLAEDIVFASGHPDAAVALPWDALAKAGTLCLFVAHKSLAESAARLVAHGRAPETPVALIRAASTPLQATLTGTLADIAEQARSAGFGKRYLMVVGETVALRESLAWFERRPLSGRTVVVTRARAQAADLVAALADLGAEVLPFPVIETVDPLDWSPADTAIRELDTYDWVVFTSVNAVDRFFERLESADRDARALGNALVAAVGPATAARCTTWGIRPDYVPSVDFRAEGVLEGFIDRGVGAGASVLLPRAEQGRDTLPDALRERGVTVDVVPVYRTVPAEGDPAVLGRLPEHAIDAVTFTSPSTVRNFLEVAERAAVSDPLCGVVAASIGPVTTKALRERGIEAGAEAAESTVDGLVDALVAAFAPRPEGCACGPGCDADACCGGAGH